MVDAKGAVVKVVDRFAGAPSTPVATTIDVAVQEAAQQALAGVSQPAALVAVDAPTGSIRAVVSAPDDQAFDRALDGQYPPGSTFKVVTATALLANGTTPDTPVSCPPQAVVGGKKFTNFEGEAPGSIPFRTAFALSCNTAFVGLADKLPVPSSPARPPPTASEPSTAWPFPPSVATSPNRPTMPRRRLRPSGRVGSRSARCTWPRLPLRPTPAGGGHPGCWNLIRRLPTQLDQGAVTSLRDLMAEVVRSGTGTAAAVPGQTIAGKTGTAEFGNANPPSTHAWFIGYRGDLAFSVLVEGGGVGGRVAAPIAARFLKSVPA